MCSMFFFFKQKTAYEMRISDWSSDVCSSDLIDPSSTNKNVRVDVPIVGDVGEVVRQILKLWRAKKKQPNGKALDAWWKQIDAWRARDCLAYKKGDRKSTRLNSSH